MFVGGKHQHRSGTATAVCDCTQQELLMGKTAAEVREEQKSLVSSKGRKRKMAAIDIFELDSTTCPYCGHIADDHKLQCKLSTSN